MSEILTETYENNSLRIELQETGDSINMLWFGKSIDRRPADFITPIISKLFQMCAAHRKSVVMDFRFLEYMNSSTITPVIKVLERAKRGTMNVTVLFDASRKWQDLSFSALKIFETEDKRVVIKGN